MTIKHWLAHLFSWNYGTIETWWDENKNLMVGFRCSVCGRLSGIHKSIKQ